MSYEIVKNIKLDDIKKEVWIKSDSNNVFPKSYTYWECVTISKIYKEQGKEEAIKQILYDYWAGTFQGSSNNFQKSLFFFDKSKYNWDYEDYKLPEEERKKRRTEIKKALFDNYTQFIKDMKYRNRTIIRNKTNGYFVIRSTSRRLFLTPTKNDCKIFKNETEAKYYIRNFDNTNYEFVNT